jgi:hypothetical protein
MAPRHGIVLFGDVVESRQVPRAASWLRTLRADLNDAFRAERLAPFEFTQGDELQGLLRYDADPFGAVVRAATHPDTLRMRWVMAVGAIDPGTGPATQRSGPAFLEARAISARARQRREPLVVRTGDEPTDRLLDGITPALARLLGELTGAQRAVARLILVDGLRQVEVARRLGIKPPTVSVASERAALREVRGLLAAARQLLVEARTPGSGPS